MKPLAETLNDDDVDDDDVDAEADDGDGDGDCDFVYRFTHIIWLLFASLRDPLFTALSSERYTLPPLCAFLNSPCD